MSMVSFSSLLRTKAKCSDLLSCFLDLNELEVKLFYTIASRGETTLDDLSDTFGKDRSTIFRNLQKLVSLGLIYKEMSSLEKGGRVARFMPNELAGIKEIVGQRIESLKRSMDSLMKDFEERIVKEMQSYAVSERERQQLKVDID